MVWRIAVFVVGAVILIMALFRAMMLALFVRLEGLDDLYDVYDQDVQTGLATTIGLFLVGIPLLARLTKRSLSLLAIATIGGGIMVGGMLAYSHLEQHQIRSTPPKSHARHLVTDGE